jgi:hypothetical protein
LIAAAMRDLRRKRGEVFLQIQQEVDQRLDVDESTRSEAIRRLVELGLKVKSKS